MWRCQTVCSRYHPNPLIKWSTGIRAVVDHNTITRLQLLLHGHNRSHSHQVTDELLLILAHLPYKTRNEAWYISQLGEVVADLGNNQNMGGGARVNVSEGAALNITKPFESDLIVLVDNSRGDLVVGNLLEESKFLSFSGHEYVFDVKLSSRSLELDETFFLKKTIYIKRRFQWRKTNRKTMR